MAVIDDGRIRIGGRRYRLRESRLQFDPAAGLVPTLFVVGETQVGDYDVTLRITGQPGSVEATYTSLPPLSQRDLRSLLVTGRVESAASQQGAGDDFALTAAATDVLGFAGRFVGLDSVRIGAADLDLNSRNVSNAQHLTLTKSFGRELELVFSENLETGPLTWIVSWRPLPGYELRAASVENTEQLLEFRQSFFFGPGAIDPPARGATITAPRVTTLSITGDPGFPEDEIRGRLKLKAGDDFDARKWIDDRVRLEDTTEYSSGGMRFHFSIGQMF